MEHRTLHNKMLHPGFKLKQELQFRKITQKDFAFMIGLQPSHLSELIRGKRNITQQIADRLEEALNISASVWMQEQAAFEFRLKTLALDDTEEIKAERDLLAYDAIYDMKELFKRVGKSKLSSSEKLAFCKEQLHFCSISQQKTVIEGYFHKSDKTGLDTRMIATWSILAIYQSSLEQDPIGRFDKSKCDELASELSVIFNDNCNTINRVSRKLSEYGVKFCIVEKVRHASIDGFSFYLDGVPTIVVTQRFNRIDNFAFAVLHELCHLKNHLSENSIGKVNVVNPNAERIEAIEQQANEYAANALIPMELWQQQPPVKLINPYTLQKVFTLFANRIGRNKWIVLGRISHETNFYIFKSDETRKIH